MQWTGIKNVKTVNDHIKRLIDAGLLVRTKLAGEHEGSIYEVILPEEVNPYQTRTRPVPDPYQRQTEEVPEPNQKTDSDQYQNSVRVGSGNLIDLIATSGEPKTSFKTKDEKPDDEAFAPLVARLRKTVTDLTGKESTAADAARWDELGELLDAELRIAAGRTGSVSSVPAFLTEHLRRRLWKKDKRQVEEEGKAVGSKRSETTKVDASKCPDCFGTGMHYPDGFDKGVARCRHEKLTASAVPAASVAPTPTPTAQPPTDGDLVEMAVGFLHQGMDIEAVGQLLSASIGAEEWPRVRTDALERYEHERGQMRPPDSA
ncbi:MAG TPA: hypothetical protein VF297_11180 [Pyrinomonadaceae bacterium]